MAPSQMRALAGVAAVLASSVIAVSTASAGPDDKKNPALRAAERSQQPRQRESTRETPRQEAPRQAPPSARPAPAPRPTPTPQARPESRNPTQRAVEASRSERDRTDSSPPPQTRTQTARTQERATTDARREQPPPSRTAEPGRNPALRAAERAKPNASDSGSTPPRVIPAPDSNRPTPTPSTSRRSQTPSGPEPTMPRGGGLRAAEVAKRNRPADSSFDSPRSIPIPRSDSANDSGGWDRTSNNSRGDFDRSDRRDRSNWDVSRRDPGRGGHGRRDHDDDRWSISIGINTGNFQFGFWSGDRCDPFFSRSCHYDPIIWRRDWRCDPWRWSRIDRCDWRPRYRHCVDPFFSIRLDWCDSWFEPCYVTTTPLIVTTPVVYLDPSPVYVQTFSSDVLTTGLPAPSSGPFFTDMDDAPAQAPAQAPVATVFRASGDLGEMAWSAVPSAIVDTVAGALPSQRAVAAAQFLSRRPAGAWQVVYEDQTYTPEGVVVRTRALNASRLGAEPAVILVIPQPLNGVRPGAVLTVSGRLSELSIDDPSYPGGVLTLDDARVGL